MVMWFHSWEIPAILFSAEDSDTGFTVLQNMQESKGRVGGRDQILPRDGFGHIGSYFTIPVKFLKFGKSK